MNAVTNEWLRRADDDLRVARRESKVTEEPSYSAVCFHAQQAAEKYLKALSIELSIPITKTHDLVFLLEQILPQRPLWSVYRSGLERLTIYAVETRYPGMEATKEEASGSLSFAEEIKKAVMAEMA